MAFGICSASFSKRPRSATARSMGTRTRDNIEEEEAQWSGKHGTNLRSDPQTKKSIDTAQLGLHTKVLLQANRCKYLADILAAIERDKSNDKEGTKHLNSEVESNLRRVLQFLEWQRSHKVLWENAITEHNQLHPTERLVLDAER